MDAPGRSMMLAPEERVDAAPDAAAGLAPLLAMAEGYFRELWPQRVGYAEQFGELRTRLVEQRLQIAVLGQFKRGKSTFLNALLGEPLLPTGVLPLTAVPAFIRWAAEPRITVTHLDGRTERLTVTEAAEINGELFRLVTEEGNPHNQAKIARVDVSFPALLLGDGIVQPAKHLAPSSH